MVHTWKCRNYMLTKYILCCFIIIIYLSISVLDWCPNYLCLSRKYLNLSCYYQTQYLLMKCSSFCDDTVGNFSSFLHCLYVFSCYNILKLVMPYLFSSVHSIPPSSCSHIRRPAIFMLRRWSPLFAERSWPTFLAH